MPPIASEKQVLDGLSKLVSPSIVAIIRYRHMLKDSIGFGTGFIIFSDCNKVLVCAHQVVVRNGEFVIVRFQDETQQDASVFMRNTKSNHVILQVAADSCPRQSVSFSECPITRENIFTIAAVEEKGKLGLMSGTISIPNCRAVRQNGVPVSESENLFAMSCPAAGPQKLGELKGEELELIGAAVFDMKGLVIGTVEWVDDRSYDIKFSVKIYLSKGQGGFAEGASTSSQGGITSGSESRKRGCEDSLGGGTGTEKSLCIDHIEVNADVVSEEKMKLHMYPIHGNMEVARREAMRLELVRLVARKSSEHLRGSASSPDAANEANKCMNVFIARNPDEVGSENGISVGTIDLNHFFGEDGKIYGYKNLKIKVWISAISFHVYADISFVETSDGITPPRTHRGHHCHGLKRRVSIIASCSTNVIEGR